MTCIDKAAYAFDGGPASTLRYIVLVEVESGLIDDDVESALDRIDFYLGMEIGKDYELEDGSTVRRLS